MKPQFRDLNLAVQAEVSRRGVMEYMVRTEANLRSLAEANGLALRLPKMNELFIDLDSKGAQEQFLERYAKFVEIFHVTDFTTTSSKSGYPHLHVIIAIDRDLTDMERVALQAALGSDPKREMLAVKNNGVAENTSVLFEVKRDEAKKESTSQETEEADDDFCSFGCGNSEDDEILF